MLYSFKFLGKRNATIQNGKNQTQISRWSVEDKGENPVNTLSRIFFLMLSLSTKKNNNSLSRSKSGTIICVITDVGCNCPFVSDSKTIN